MDKMLIKGGSVLKGEVVVSGAKNSVLKLLFASLLAEGEHVFTNVPHLKDVDSTADLLRSLNCEVSFQDHVFRVVVKKPEKYLAHYDLVRKMRASILTLGPLLAKYGEATISLPGGCAIGTRPIDLHIEALKLMGAEITVENGYVHAKSKRLKGTRILFDNVTVGGTENLLMAATLAEGTTILENAAKEPEIVDLANYLITLGAKIKGQGSGVIEIEGVESLKPSGQSFEVMCDRIEAGTLLIAGAISKGEVSVIMKGHHHIDALLMKLKEAGLLVVEEKGRVTVKYQGQIRAVDITTAPYPQFATDLQAQYMALMSIAEGTSLITETVFENRFMHVQELVRMNADITPKARVAVVRGRPDGLSGAPVMATDLRASASLVLAGLAAKGETLVQRIYHLDRGYEKLETKLMSLGADIKRVGE